MEIMKSLHSAWTKWAKNLSISTYLTPLLAEDV